MVWVSINLQSQTPLASQRNANSRKVSQKCFDSYTSKIWFKSLFWETGILRRTICESFKNFKYCVTLFYAFL